MAGSMLIPYTCALNKKFLFYKDVQMILLLFFEIPTGFDFEKMPPLPPSRCIGVHALFYARGGSDHLLFTIFSHKSPIQMPAGEIFSCLFDFIFSYLWSKRMAIHFLSMILEARTHFDPKDTLTPGTL